LLFYRWFVVERSSWRYEVATTTQTGPVIKKTLGLTGVTVNAMALIAPGAFLWMTYQLQAASTDASGASTAADLWTGIVAALVVAFLTAFAFAELARRYPEAGTGSAYYFAETAFLDRPNPGHRRWARIAKFITGWAAHLFYWVYPGIMVAFMAVLVNYFAGQFGINIPILGQILIAWAFAGLVGLIAIVADWGPFRPLPDPGPSRARRDERHLSRLRPGQPLPGRAQDPRRDDDRRSCAV
jgi:amino acid transporter